MTYKLASKLIEVLAIVFALAMILTSCEKQTTVNDVFNKSSADFDRDIIKGYHFIDTGKTDSASYYSGRMDAENEIINFICNCNSK